MNKPSPISPAFRNEKNPACTSIHNRVSSPPILVLVISKKTISPVRFPSYFLIMFNGKSYWNQRIDPLSCNHDPCTSRLIGGIPKVEDFGSNPQTLWPCWTQGAYGSRTSLISLHNSCHSCHLIPDGFPKPIAAKLLRICKSDVCIHGHILSSVRFNDLSVFIFIPEMQLSSSYLGGQPVLMPYTCTQAACSST